MAEKQAGMDRGTEHLREGKNWGEASPFLIVVWAIMLEMSLSFQSKWRR